MSRKSIKILNWILPMIFAMVMLFAVTVTASAANDDTVTRKEWMTDLKATYELDQEDMSMLPEEFFSDPEATATREFAATTVNYFIGFELNQSLGYSFTDAADVTDKDSAEYAVKKNLLALKDGDVFSPDTPITVAEKDSMLEAAKHIWESQYSMVDTYGEDAIGAARLIVDNDLTGGARHTLYIPKKLNGKTVKYISSGAFQNNTDISFVKIPNTVTGIEANAFNGCTGLGGTLTIPEQVTEMGSRAFGNCTNITKVIIPVDFKYANSQEPFYGCTGVTEIHYTYGQTGIMRDVYGYISNDSGNYYSSRLEYSTRNSLKTVSFEEGITKIGSGAYFNAFDSSNTYPCTKLKTVMLPASLTEIGSNAFKRCTSLNYIKLPNGFTTLGEGCFMECTSLFTSDSPDETMTLEDIGMPANVSNIPRDCFSGCTGLGGTLTIPDQITTLDGNAFKGCTGINKVVIPVDFKYTRGQEPFNGCTGVTEIHYTYGQTGIMLDVYGYISNDSGNYYSSRLEYSTRNSLKTVSFEEGITKIGSGAYFNAYDSSNTYPCTKLKTVILPASLTEIGANAFKRCTALNYIKLPNGFTTLGEGCFMECTSLFTSDSPDETMTLEDIGMPANVSNIPRDCFSGCTGLGGTLTIPDQITTLDGNAFKGCTGINKVIIPVDFKYTRGQEPFNGCAGVTEIHYTYGQTGIMRDVYGIGSNADGNYYNCRLEYSTRNSLKTVSFEEGITKIGSGAYFNAYDSSNTYPCTKLKTVILPASLTEIGANAFKRCTSLEGELTILENVTTIGGSAFSGCNKLDTIRFYGSMPQIGSNAFQGITATAYYPRAHSESWTEEGRQNYGGTLTWYLWPKIKAETPAQPTVTENGITENSVTLTAIVGYEYGILNKDTDEIDWGQENTFNSLSPKTEYTFYQRVAESPEYYASDASEGLTVRTLKTAAEIEEDQAAAAAVTEAIAALPTVVTVNDKAAIEAARTAYDALTDDQKALVSEATLQKLIDAEAALAVAEEAAAIDQAAAAGVTDSINDLPDANIVTISDKAAIEAARTAYDALTDDQKALVSEATLQKLIDAEAALAVAEEAAAIDQAAAAGVTDSINDLPDANIVTISDKAAIEAARTAYDALTDDQKALVSEATLQKLIDAEAALAVAEEATANQAAADAVIAKINALPEEATLVDKAAIKAARDAYDALTDAQKALVSTDTFKKLTDAETTLAAAEAAAAEAGKSNSGSKTPSSTAPPAATGENVIVDLKAVKISKPKAAKKAVTVKWKKVGKKDQKKIQGIEIQISTDSGFQNIVKKTTAGKKKTSKKIKGLKSKTKYWVRIRAYRNDTAGKHVSAWKKKSFKVK